MFIKAVQTVTVVIGSGGSTGKGKARKVVTIFSRLDEIQAKVGTAGSSQPALSPIEQAMKAAAASQNEKLAALERKLQLQLEALQRQNQQLLEQMNQQHRQLLEGLQQRPLQQPMPMAQWSYGPPSLFAQTLTTGLPPASPSTPMQQSRPKFCSNCGIPKAGTFCAACGGKD